ncbi:MAG: hypothetical protein H7X71_01935 [Chitinophagales bacterium]|nr:hypothetical protein [Chitinophagales bacterium]
MKNIITLFLIVFVSAELSFAQNVNPADTSKKTEKSSDGKIQYIIAAKQLKLTGYTQPRFQYFQDTTKISTFDIRRARLALTGNMTDKIEYRFFAEFGGSVPPQLLEAIFTYKADDRLKVAVGQMLVPLGNDIIASETKMESVNRVVLSEVLGARGQDVIGNQNARDIGLSVAGTFKRKDEADFFKYTIGVFNGTGINKLDNNQDKAIAGRMLISPVKNLWAGGSYYNGSSRWGDDVTIDKNRDRYAFELEYKWKTLILRSEYMAGQDDTINRYGYYVQLIGDIIPKKIQLSGRFEFFDFNEAVVDDGIYLYTITPSYLWGDNAKVQFGYDIVMEESTEQKKNNVFQAQFQLAF